jgi:hypothetical protein
VFFVLTAKNLSFYLRALLIITISAYFYVAVVIPAIISRGSTFADSAAIPGAKFRVFVSDSRGFSSLFSV